MYGRFRDGANKYDSEAVEASKVYALEDIKRSMQQLVILLEQILRALEVKKNDR